MLFTCLVITIEIIVVMHRTRLIRAERKQNTDQIMEGINNKVLSNTI